MSIKNRTIFITGGAGFIGSTLAVALCADNRVILFDNLSRNTLQHTRLSEHRNVKVVNGDVLDYDALARSMQGADIVVHAAAIAGIDTVIKSPIKTMEVNMIGTANVLRAALAPFVGGPQDKGWLQQVWFNQETTRRIVLTYPLAFVFGRYPTQGGGLSFLALACLPLALLFLTRPRPFSRSTLAQVTVVALVGLLLWVFLHPSVIAPRYLLATLLLFYLIAAKGAEYAWEADTPLRLIRFGIAGTLFVALLAAAYPLWTVGWAALMGRFSQDECALASKFCAPLTSLNRIACPGDRVYMTNYSGYWLRPDLLQCRDNREDERAVRSSPVPLEALCHRGFRFVVVDRTSHGEMLSRLESSPLPSWLSAEKVFESSDLSTWRLVAKSPRGCPALTCRQLNPPAWNVVPLP